MSYGYPQYPQQQGYPPGQPQGYPGQYPQGYPQGYGFPPAERKHSGVGIASFVMSLLAGLGIFVLFAWAGYLQINDPAAVENEDDPRMMALGFGFVVCIFLVLVGIGLGIGGVLQGDKKKLFGILGLTFNGLIVLVTVGLIVLGLAVGG
ncbi:MAG TPA: DUF3824 domain-containing protein [Tepidisphaeraceae bacterium]|nr:DUF3824 domain-containing protein [Tepidisphaeraceae bacterium]